MAGEATSASAGAGAVRPDGWWPLVAAVWLALAGGLVEVGLEAFAKFVLHRYVHLSLQTAWQAPVSLALIVVLVTLPLLVAAARRPDRRLAGIAIGAAAALAALDPLLTLTRVHWLARLILAAGVGAAAARALSAHPRAQRLLRRTLPVPVAAVAALFLSVNGLLRVRELRLEAALPPPPAGAPNVLLLILDTVRSLNLSLYGYSRPTTPNLERLAVRGVTFDRAVSPSPWTLPAHASIFTGHWPHQLEADWRAPLEPDVPTLAERLASRGWRTAGFTANYEYASRESGLSRGFVRFEAYRITAATIAFGSAIARWVAAPAMRERLHWAEVIGRKTAAHLRSDITRWTRAHRDRPFFVFANYYDAHAPYLPPAPYDTVFAGRRLAWSERNVLQNETRPVTPEQVRADQLMYDGALAALDQQLGSLLDELEREGLLANTLVIVTSDHGEEFGEHGLISHGYSLYLPSLRVPLIVVQPGRVPAGRRVAEWVSTRDLAATVLDLVGADPALPGRSLRRCWSEAGCGADTLHAELRHASGLPAAFPVSQGDLRSALADPWYYIATATADLLFDLATDSAETRDRARDPSATAPLEAMRNAVRRGPSLRARADAAGARLARRLAEPVLTRAWR